MRSETVVDLQGPFRPFKVYPPACVTPAAPDGGGRPDGTGECLSSLSREGSR